MTAATYIYVPLIGLVPAGFPSPAEEELTDIISLEEYLVPNRDATFMVRVAGDTMKHAGIMPGDIVFVERGRVPRSNDIVIARVDNETKMGFWRDLKPKTTLELLGVVISVMRKYH